MLTLQQASEAAPSSAASQSSSRKQRASDPGRESTALFNRFTASTAESGLLEVEEIAHINGSPELVRHAADDSTALQAEAQIGPVQQTGAELIYSSHLGSDALNNQPARLNHYSRQGATQQQHQQQQQKAGNVFAVSSEGEQASNTLHARPDAEQLGNAEDSGSLGSEPSLKMENSSPRLQTAAEASTSAQGAASGVVSEHNKPTPQQVLTDFASIQMGVVLSSIPGKRTITMYCLLLQLTVLNSTHCHVAKQHWHAS